MSDIVLFLSIVFAGLAGWLSFHRERTLRFRPKAILTGCDVELFERLRAALPHCTVAPGVGVLTLIEPTGPLAARLQARRRLAGQRVDFAVFDESLRLLAVIEAAHRSRRTRAQAERERHFAGAGVRVIRLRAGGPPSDARIRAAVFGKSGAHGPKAEGQAFDYQAIHTPWRNTLDAHI